jgi:hypothetical protein
MTHPCAPCFARAVGVERDAAELGQHRGDVRHVQAAASGTHAGDEFVDRGAVALAGAHDVAVAVAVAVASDHTMSPRRSAQNRNRGSSNFWCTRVALKPRPLINCTSTRSAPAQAPLTRVAQHK